MTCTCSAFSFMFDVCAWLLFSVSTCIASSALVQLDIYEIWACMFLFLYHPKSYMSSLCIEELGGYSADKFHTFQKVKNENAAIIEPQNCTNILALIDT